MAAVCAFYSALSPSQAAGDCARTPSPGGPPQPATRPRSPRSGRALLRWLLGRTEKFPRRAAHTLRQRIDTLALDVFERLIEARYTRDRAPILRQINLDLEKLRLLLRLAHEQAVLDPSAFRHACGELWEVGRMIGGWQRASEAA